MNHTDVVSDRNRSIALAVAFAAVAVLVTLDVSSDVSAGAAWRHVVVECAVVGIGIVGSAVMAVRVVRLLRVGAAAHHEAVRLSEQLASANAEAARWRTQAASLIAGLSDAIDQQLARWGLTGAEKEVALLLLKGLSHKDISTARGIGEATVRQQAASVYRKAGLQGRHDLAAFFLEDLLGPNPSRTATTPTATTPPATTPSR